MQSRGHPVKRCLLRKATISRFRYCRMRSGRALGLDYGRARIGLAVSDELGLLAHPRPALPAEPRARVLRALRTLVKEEEIVVVVLGLPRNMDGTSGRSEVRVREFARELEQALSLDVVLVDERLSTVQASLLLREGGTRAREQKEKIDSAAAAILLQTYLDGRGAEP